MEQGVTITLYIILDQCYKVYRIEHNGYSSYLGVDVHFNKKIKIHIVLIQILKTSYGTFGT